MEPSHTTNSKVLNKPKASLSTQAKEFKPLISPVEEPIAKADPKPQKSVISESLKNTGLEAGKFRDPEFPADLNSLIGKFTPKELSEQGNSMKWWTKIVWLRLDEIYGKNNYRILNDDIKPSDIMQGDISDCWIRASLSALAEYPRRIRTLFKSAKVSKEGFYEIWVCDMGVWKIVKIDDYIPCCARKRKPIFASGSKNGVWVELIHKALAKLYGCYANLVEGLCAEAFHNLTGAPTIVHYVDGNDRKKIIGSILHNAESRSAMTCGSRDDAESGVEAAGLVECHAYSILGVVHLRGPDNKRFSLLKIRNPYGDRESTDNWNGDWSAKSTKWTPDLKKQIDFQNRDEGVFYMSFHDFFEYFFIVEICKVQDSFKHSSLKLSTGVENEFLFKVNIQEKGSYCITINQQNSRKYMGDEDYEYSEVFLALMDTTNTRYISYVRKTDRETWIYVELEPGDYHVYTKLAVQQGETKEFSISCYGPGEAKIEKSLEPIKKKKKFVAENNVKKEEKDEKQEKVENIFEDDEDKRRRGKGKRKGKGKRREGNNIKMRNLEDC